jgi:hypothetical protein
MKRGPFRADISSTKTEKLQRIADELRASGAENV